MGGRSNESSTVSGRDRRAWTKIDLRNSSPRKSMTGPGRPALRFSLPMTHCPTRSAMTGTGSPPCRSLSFPVTARIASRSVSASTRRTRLPPNRILSGSASTSAASRCSDCCQAVDVRMSRCSRLRLHPDSTNSAASQSSSSGCDGRSPRKPKSPGVATMPRPKWCIQTRLTITRASSGWSPSVSRRAHVSRRPVVGSDSSFGAIGSAASGVRTVSPAGVSSCFGCS